MNTVYQYTCKWNAMDN